MPNAKHVDVGMWTVGKLLLPLLMLAFTTSSAIAADYPKAPKILTVAVEDKGYAVVHEVCIDGLAYVLSPNGTLVQVLAPTVSAMPFGWCINGSCNTGVASIKTAIPRACREASK